MGTATRLMRKIPDQLGRPGGVDAGKAQPLPAAVGRVEWFVRTDIDASPWYENRDSHDSQSVTSTAPTDPGDSEPKTHGRSTSRRGRAFDPCWRLGGEG